MAALIQAGAFLSATEPEDPHDAAQLLPLVYNDLRRLAAHRLANEPPGQTLQPTGLVHEAYLRLVGADPTAQWNSRGHFFAAAAEAMRRILVENARHKKTVKRGGCSARRDLDLAKVLTPAPREDLLAVDEAWPTARSLPRAWPSCAPVCPLPT
jgi:RNA polymerase sigma factor (TIGR02999 family)